MDLSRRPKIIAEGIGVVMIARRELVWGVCGDDIQDA